MASVSRLGEATEPGIQMISPDDNGRLQLAACNHLVEGKPEPVTVAEPNQQMRGRQALERGCAGAPCRASDAGERHRASIP